MAAANTPNSCEFDVEGFASVVDGTFIPCTVLMMQLCPIIVEVFDYVSVCLFFSFFGCCSIYVALILFKQMNMCLIVEQNHYHTYWIFMNCQHNQRNFVYMNNIYV